MSKTVLRYKYLPFDEGSLCVISNGTIKFSNPDEFNDPFDCSPEFDVEENSRYLSKRRDILKMAGDASDYSPSERIQNKNKMLKRVEKAMAEENYGKSIADELGICCLSRDPLNLLMWAHYANNHTGFVVEFSIPKSGVGTIAQVDDYILKWLFPLEVVYTKEKPVINLFDDRDINMKKHFLTKSDDWGYEEEERVIDYIRGHGIHSYDRKTVLKSVIAGMRISDANFDKLQSAITSMNHDLKTDVHLYRTKAVRGFFSLYVPERIDLTSSEDSDTQDKQQN